MKKLMVLVLASGLSACAPQSSFDSQSSDSTAIVGGEFVSRLSPVGSHTVGIYESKIGYICSGTLIANNIVLTAAHCVAPGAKDIRIVFGTNMKSTAKDRFLPVDKAIINPLWETNQNEVRNTGDIALLRFVGTAPVGYRPAAILKETQLLVKGARSTMAGYGLSWTTGVSAGSGILRSTTLEIDDAQFSDTEALIGQSVKKGICSGDSGGPAYMTVNGQLKVWGVASRGDSIPIFLVPKCMLFSVFTRIDAHQDWLNESLARLQK